MVPRGALAAGSASNQSLESVPMVLGRQLHHRLGERRDVIRVNPGCNAMAQVEDVPRMAGISPKNIDHFCLDGRPRGTQQGWVEVPLERLVGADSSSGDVERYPPVDADDVGASLRHCLLYTSDAADE